MSRRLRRCLLVVAALALAGCDLDRLPQSDQALSPGAQRTNDVDIGGPETMDHHLDSAPYVAADPL